MIRLDDTLSLQGFTADVAVGVASLGDDYVRVVHVVAASEFTVPLSLRVTQEASLRLASAIAEWDAGMAEAGDDPLRAPGPKPSAKAVIRSFIPSMLPCAFRELFCSTYRIPEPA